MFIGEAGVCVEVAGESDVTNNGSPDSSSMYIYILQ